MVTVSALAATLFLGGWRAPFPISTIWAGANSGWWPLLWFVAKVILGIFVFVWLRGTLPRLRYDQFMAFGWKVLVPVALVWILFIGTFSVLRSEGRSTGQLLLYGVLPLAAIIIVATLFWPEGRDEEDEELEQPPARRGAPASGAFPVPPMDLSIPPSPRLRAREPVSTVPATDAEVIDSDDPRTGENR
jgi:NADH-quinone oxidoreductase subunit H